MKRRHDFSLRGKAERGQLVLSAAERVGLIWHLAEHLVEVKVDSRGGSGGGVTVHKLHTTTAVNRTNHLR